MKKNYHNMLSRFHLIPEHHGQMDGQTDRIAISVIDRFSKFFTRRLSSNFVARLFSSSIPLDLKFVATLPCEILISETRMPGLRRTAELDRSTRLQSFLTVLNYSQLSPFVRVTENNGFLTKSLLSSRTVCM